MIFVTGDTHGDHDRYKIDQHSWPEGQGLTRNDILVICGDFGALWSGDARDEEILRWYECQPWTTLFVDGNHENFDLIEELPVSTRFGGRVHTIPGYPHVIHLMRGEVYDLPVSASKTVRAFVMGGAPSVDADCRIPGLTWWSAEMPDYEEYDNAQRNLERVGWSVDYVFTHEVPRDGKEDALAWNDDYYDDDDVYDADPVQDELADFLQRVDDRLNKKRLKMWYAGHYHVDCEIMDDQHCVLYEQVVELGVAPF